MRPPSSSLIADSNDTSTSRREVLRAGLALLRRRAAGLERRRARRGCEPAQHLRRLVSVVSQGNQRARRAGRPFSTGRRDCRASTPRAGGGATGAAQHRWTTCSPAIIRRREAAPNCWKAPCCGADHRRPLFRLCKRRAPCSPILVDGATSPDPPAQARAPRTAGARRRCGACMIDDPRRSRSMGRVFPAGASEARVRQAPRFAMAAPGHVRTRGATRPGSRGGPAMMARGEATRRNVGQAAARPGARCARSRTGQSAARRRAGAVPHFARSAAPCAGS